MSDTDKSDGPHRALQLKNPRDQFIAEVFDHLWETYRQRVSYVKSYERVVRQAGAKFVNDHIAFRTFAGQDPFTGIHMLSRIFEALGYRAAGVYHFEDKHLSAQHLQHGCPELPKLFISEIKTWQLSQAADEIIQRSLQGHRAAISSRRLRDLAALEDGQTDSLARDSLLTDVLNEFQQLPWPLPNQNDVLQLSQESQYAAWVLVHGYHVNHFTSLVNSHGVDALDDLEKTVQALRAAGVPMKETIEGARGSKLRQSATEAVKIEVEVESDGRRTTMPWSYAYFELAERNLVVDAVTGKQTRFEGFLGPQATNLFEMTRIKQ